MSFFLLRTIKNLPYGIILMKWLLLSGISNGWSGYMTMAWLIVSFPASRVRTMFFQRMPYLLSRMTAKLGFHTSSRIPKTWKVSCSIRLRIHMRQLRCRGGIGNAWHFFRLSYRFKEENFASAKRIFWIIPACSYIRQLTAESPLRAFSHASPMRWSKADIITSRESSRAEKDISQKYQDPKPSPGEWSASPVKTKIFLTMTWWQGLRHALCRSRTFHG